MSRFGKEVEIHWYHKTYFKNHKSSPGASVLLPTRVPTWIKAGCGYEEVHHIILPTFVKVQMFSSDHFVKKKKKSQEPEWFIGEFYMILRGEKLILM